MAILTRFAREERIHASIPGCPLWRPGAGPADTRACAPCPFNAAHAGEPQIGCVLRTPPEVLEAARARLEARAPDLARQLEQLRGTSPVVPSETDRWLELARAWYAGGADVADEEREVIAVIARFAEAAARTGEPVELLA